MIYFSALHIIYIYISWLAIYNVFLYMTRSTLVEFGGSLFNIWSLRGCHAWSRGLWSTRPHVLEFRSFVATKCSSIAAFLPEVLKKYSLNPINFSTCPICVQIWKVQTKQFVFRSLKRGAQKELFPLAFLKFFARRVSSSSEAASPRAFELQELSVYSKLCVSRVSFFKTNYHRLIMFHCEKTWCAFVLKRSLFHTFHLNPSPLLLEKSKDPSLSLQLKMRPYAE